MKRLGLLLIVGSILTGCATPTPPPTAPQAPAALTIDTRELSDVRAKIAAMKDPPEDPVLRRYRKEELVNKAPTLHASDPLLKTGSKDVRVAVEAFGAEGKPGEAQADAADRAVADALCLELQRKRVNLVEREYADLKKADGALSKQPAADYVILIHRARDNREAAKPQFINMPWYVPETVWKEYRQKRIEYEQARARFREQVENYNLTLQRIARQSADTIENDTRWKDYENRYREYESRYNAYVSDARGRETAPPKVALVTERYRITAPAVKPAPEPSAPAKNAGLEQQILTDLSKHNFVPYQGKVDMPAFLDDPSEIVGRAQGRNTDELVTIHQFAMSIRVIDMKEGKTAWYGYVEAQNLSYINAVKECCEALVESLVAQAAQ